MCAIFGGFRVTPPQLAAMGRALRHRGPDGDGRFTAGPFAVGMNRLAVLDPVGGGQPFALGDGSVQAVCNGEIYNWRELREELAAAGHVFRAECDCEIIPAAWRAWGRGMLERFNGMFSLALHDTATGGLFLARDRCGQKPLHFARHGDAVLFASEPKALFAAGVTPEWHPATLDAYLMLRYVPEPATAFAGIESLPAGHCMEIDGDGRHRVERWWAVPESLPWEGDYGSAVDRLEHLVDQSVAAALQSDVPRAVYLSAGVDSSLLADALRRAGGDVEALSLGFGHATDEVAEARSLARRCGLPFHAVECRVEDLLELPRVIGQMDVPVGDALIVAFDRLASACAGIGCKVALGGEGADEIFAGYGFHHALARALQLGPAGRWLAAGALEAAPAALLDRFSGFPAALGGEGRAKVTRYLRGFNAADPWWRGVGLRTLFEPHELDRLYHPDRSGSSWRRAVPDGFFAGDLLDRHLRFQFQDWLQDWAIIRQDRNAMAHGVEYRMPFLDHRLIDFGFSLPNAWKLPRGGKRIWRDVAARRLPARVTRRAKQPFYFPVEALTGDARVRRFLEDVLAPENLQAGGLFRPAEVERLLQRALGGGEFVAVKKVMALAIFEIWRRGLGNG